MATSTGVRLLVQNDGASAGTFLDLQIPGGPGISQQLSTAPAEWVWSLPPGPLQFSCRSVGTTGTSWGDLTLTVADPGGFWRSTTLADLGCGDGQPNFDASHQNDHWATARQAVEAWFPVLGGSGVLTAEQAPMGYPDAPVQTWLVLRDGKPSVVVTVWSSGGGFATDAGTICSGA